jgi:WD40 repeat protein
MNMEYNMKNYLKFLFILTFLFVFLNNQLESKPRLQVDVNFYINYGYCSGLKVSPNEQMLATISGAGILIWDLEKNKLIKNIVDSLDIDFVDWIDDQRICIANCQGYDNKIKILDLNADIIKEYMLKTTQGRNNLKLSADRTKLYYRLDDNLLIIDVNSDEILTYSGIPYYIDRCWSFDNDNTVGFSFIEDSLESSIRLCKFNFKTKKLNYSKDKIDERILLMSYDPNKKLVASVQNDSILYVWDAQSLKVIKKINLENSIYNLVFSSDGDYIYCSLSNHQIVKISVADLNNNTIIADNSYNRHFLINNNETNIIYFNEKEIIFKDLTSGEIINVIEKYSGYNYTREIKGYWSPDNSKIATIENFTWNTSKLILWDANTCELLRNKIMLTVDDIAWSPDGKKLLVPNSFGTGAGFSNFKILDTMFSDYEEYYDTYYCGILESVSWSKNSKIAVGGQNTNYAPTGYTIYLYSYDVSTNHINNINVLNIDKKDKNKLSLSPDGSLLAIYQDKTIRIINPENGNEILSRNRRLTSDVNEFSLDWSPDSKNIAYFLNNDSISIYNLISFTEIILNLPSYSRVLSWSPNGKYLAVCSSELLLYDTSNWKVIKKYTSGNLLQVRSIGWSPDSKNILITTNGDLIVVFKADSLILGTPDSYLNSTMNFSISPNPATDFIEIDLTRWAPLAKWSPSVEIRIFNVIGEIQTTPSLCDTPPWKGGEKVKIDVSGLVSGLYFVRIGDTVGKFVKM